MLSSQELIEKIREYHHNVDDEIIKKAYNTAKEAHKSQVRSSGEPYFSHPIAVCEILIDLKLDVPSIVTAILHDTVEDTDVTLDDIRNDFGEEIASLVDGVTKLTKIESLSASKRAAENFRKLVMAMSQDIRVLLVKLADRLHNMRTIGFISSKEKRNRISNESLVIYAPLAARIGAYNIRDELQEIAFAQTHPQERDYIIDSLTKLKKKRRSSIDNVINGLKSNISKHLKSFEIYGREKKPYSIWNKMRQKNISFYHLYDIMAFRIVVNDILDCYKVLGVINSNYSMIPGSFKDYISTPKENNYRSIHLVILGPDNKKIEIQIRDNKMHEVAEHGVAAHWSYKQKEKINKDGEQYKWIRDLISLFEHASDASEVLQNHRIQLHKDEVFCFTPDGDIFNLPNGATIIDFAYAIHSDIGNACISAKINGNTTPLSQVLENGDQIEIITDKKVKPSPSWLQFVTTSRAKAAIKHFIRNEKFNEYRKLGKAIIEKYFRKHSLDLNDKLIEKALVIFNKKTSDDLYIAIAEGVISRDEVLSVIYPNFQIKDKDKSKENNEFLPIDGLISDMAINFAPCCNPIPGDKIVGIINVGSGVMVHSKNCSKIVNMPPNNNILIDVCWSREAQQDNDHYYNSRIKITLKNHHGSLAQVSSTMAKRKINITNIDIINRSEDFFEIILDVGVKGTKHLELVILSLRILESVLEVERYDSKIYDREFLQ